MIIIIMFIIGTIFGSFYNVVGYRLPKNESIIYPSSHCPKCNHKLKAYELIPIISYIFQKGKCTKCKQKISLFYPFFELLTGLTFALAYISFGPTKELIIALTFLSMLIIITISDYQCLIIPDSVLITFSLALITEIAIIYGINEGINSILNGIAAFIFMFALKKFGDIIFKKESMGGGDIKLLFVFGLVLKFPLAVFSIFLGSLIGLPISLITLNKNQEHIIPFGPFLAAGGAILLLSKVTFETIISFL